MSLLATIMLSHGRNIQTLVEDRSDIPSAIRAAEELGSFEVQFMGKGPSDGIAVEVNVVRSHIIGWILADTTGRRIMPVGGLQIMPREEKDT